MTLTLELLERALDQTGSLIDGIRPADQGQLPTPCTDWDVRTLVNHTVYDLQTFARNMTKRAPLSDQSRGRPMRLHGHSA